MGDVRFRLDGPENGSYLLLHALRRRHLTERKVALLVESIVALEDFEDRGLEIHGVVMNELVPVCDQFSGLRDAIFDTISLDVLIILLDLFKSGHNVFRHLRFSELAHSMESIVPENWHDSWDDFTLNSC